MKTNKKPGRNRKETIPVSEITSAKNTVANMLDIPQTSLFGVPQLSLSGNGEALVEGCRGVLEYDEGVVKLATEKMSIKFTGRNLQIKVLTHDSAVVTGFILTIEFIT